MRRHKAAGMWPRWDSHVAVPISGITSRAAGVVTFPSFLTTLVITGQHLQLSPL